MEQLSFCQTQGVGRSIKWKILQQEKVGDSLVLALSAPRRVLAPPR